MSACRLLVASAAALVLLAASSAGASHKGLRCSAPDNVTRFKVALPSTARAIRRGKALIVVAIGSSSTEGVGASDPAHSYPSLLAEELRRRWPHLAVVVLNMGVGGEMADQMLARFERDVMPYRPHLVIWQTGSNQVIKRGDIKGYTDTIREGIGRLKAARTDVVLMDPQYAPRVIARPVHQRIVDSIRAVASDLKVGVFQRFAVMRHWVSSGRHKMEEIVARDQLHMNDVSYGCIARLLADSLTAAARATPPPPDGGPASGVGPRAATTVK
jgi:lysophospholipase L1-like esterase